MALVMSDRACSTRVTTPPTHTSPSCTARRQPRAGSSPLGEGCADLGFTRRGADGMGRAWATGGARAAAGSCAVVRGAKMGLPREFLPWPPRVTAGITSSPCPLFGKCQHVNAHLFDENACRSASASLRVGLRAFVHLMAFSCCTDEPTGFVRHFMPFSPVGP